MWNLRDIGGYATPGGRVRTGLVWRSSAPDGLAARGLGIRTAIDMREPREIGSDPADLGPGIEVISHPIVEVETLPDETHTVDGFCRFMVREKGRQSAGVVRLVANADEPLVYFCVSGKDRSGVITGLLLSSLGVSDDDVADDFQRTEDLIPEEAVQRATETAAQMGISPTTTRAGMTAARTVMLDLLADLRADYGGAAEYLLAHGLGEAELERLRGRLVERA